MSNSTVASTTSENSPDTVTTAIVKRVASITGQDIDQVPPLYGTIDPDALEALVDSTNASATSLSIAFEYAGHHVTVTGDGTVHVGSAET